MRRANPARGFFQKRTEAWREKTRARASVEKHRLDVPRCRRLFPINDRLKTWNAAGGRSAGISTVSTEERVSLPNASIHHALITGALLARR